MKVDFTLPHWRFEERVANMMAKGNTRAEAEEIVRTVITTKEVEQPPEQATLWA